jgi:hypothetical protein
MDNAVEVSGVKPDWPGESAVGVRRAFSSGCKLYPATAPAGSNRSAMEVTKWLKGIVRLERLLRSDKWRNAR